MDTTPLTSLHRDELPHAAETNIFGTSAPKTDSSVINTANQNETPMEATMGSVGEYPEVRPPTDAEIEGLKEYYRQNSSMYGLEDDDSAGIEWLITGTCIAVFPDYITGGPGWFGKVMVIVYDASPSTIDILLSKDTQWSLCLSHTDEGLVLG